MRRRIAETEVGQRQVPRFGCDGLHVGGRITVVLVEGGEVEAGRQLDQWLIEPHQQVVNLCGSASASARENWNPSSSGVDEDVRFAETALSGRHSDPTGPAG